MIKLISDGHAAGIKECGSDSNGWRMGELLAPKPFA